MLMMSADDLDYQTRMSEIATSKKEAEQKGT